MKRKRISIDEHVFDTEGLDPGLLFSNGSDTITQKEAGTKNSLVSASNRSAIFGDSKVEISMRDMIEPAISISDACDIAFSSENVKGVHFKNSFREDRITSLNGLI
jgi:hypothetical protein